MNNSSCFSENNRYKAACSLLLVVNLGNNAFGSYNHLSHWTTRRIAANDSKSSGRAANYENAEYNLNAVKNTDLAKQITAGNTGSTIISNTITAGRPLNAFLPTFSFLPARDATKCCNPDVAV